ncbi:MAG TPA: ASCH domain-containing protein, partial [Planctomycetes bacterium]|nr:ASCH domain-containing protein [Planctomycetota bacterium]
MADWRRDRPRRSAAAAAAAGPGVAGSAPASLPVASAPSATSPEPSLTPATALEPQLATPAPAPPRFKRLRLGAGAALPPTADASSGSLLEAANSVDSFAPVTRSQARAAALRDCALPVQPLQPDVGPSSAAPASTEARAKESSQPPSPSRTANSSVATSWPTRALKLHHQWLELLLDGSKTWEVRSKPTKNRGRVALASTETQLLHGDVELLDCKEISRQEFAANAHKHQVNDPETTAKVFKYKKIFAWIVSRPRTYVAPTPFPNPGGSVVFVVLHSPEVVFAHAAVPAVDPPETDTPATDAVAPSDDTLPPQLTSSAAAL